MQTLSRNPSISGGEQWQEQARHKQREFYEKYGNRVWWTGTPRQQSSQLHDEIGSLLYGNIMRLEQGEAFNYSVTQTSKIKGVIKKVTKYFESETYIALIFICVYIKSKIEIKYVFRVWDGEKQMHIDCDNRVYCTWQAYLRENKLSRCSLCVPVNGRYVLDDEGNVLVEFLDSPSSRCQWYTLLVLDVLFLVLALLGLITALVAQSVDEQPLKEKLDVAAIATISSAAFYNIVRSAYALYDLIKHF